MIVYIATPYSNDPCVNVNNAVKIAEQVVAKGHTPLLPILSHLWHLISPHDWEYWIKIDLELLKKADIVLRINGESKGAKMELDEAELHGIPIIYSIDELK